MFSSNFGMVEIIFAKETKITKFIEVKMKQTKKILASLSLSFWLIITSHKHSTFLFVFFSISFTN
jgi:hypothetical protein